MKWLQDNPIGMILAAISGVFLLIALGMTIIWSLPVSTDTAGVETEIVTADPADLAAPQIGGLGDYQVINEKPVFNESRQPMLAELDDELQEDDVTIEVKDAPDVKLTGIVITPSARIASLTPSDGKIEAVMAYEGESLTGEFVGWRVAAVNPRTVVLESRDGQSLELDLQVHDVKIKEPPPIVVPAAITQAQAGQAADTDEEDNEPLSRAEQIRQRIAERREELRLEQEAQQSQSETQTATAGRSTKPSAYESAIRALMKNKSKDQGTNDKKDG
jgi:hypothetical protein